MQDQTVDNETSESGENSEDRLVAPEPQPQQPQQSQQPQPQ